MYYIGVRDGKIKKETKTKHLGFLSNNILDQCQDVYKITGAEKYMTENLIGEKEPEDHWSCIAHLSAKDTCLLKSAIIEEKSLKILNLSDLGQVQ